MSRGEKNIKNNNNNNSRFNKKVYGSRFIKIDNLKLMKNWDDQMKGMAFST